MKKFLLLVLIGMSAHAQVTITGLHRKIFTAASSVPALVQGPFSTANDVQTQSPINSTSFANSYMQKCFANSTQAGNTIIVEVVTASTIANMAISDDGSSSNTYAIPSGASEVAGSQTHALFVATVTNASKCIKLTFTATTGAINDQMVLSEWENLGAVDQTCAATVTSGTSLACSAMTTTASGDFIIGAANVVTYSSKPSGFANSFTAQSGWALLHAHGVDWSASQTEIQAASGSVTPTITVSAAVTRANIVGIAFKAASAGAGHPTGHPYIISVQNQNTGNSAWGFSNTSTATAQSVQFPCQGDDPWLLIGQINTATISSVTDNNGNTWAGLTRVNSTGDGFAIQWWHTTNASPTCNGTEKVTVTFSANPSTLIPLFVFFDIGLSGGYDSSATCGSGSTPCAINASTCTSTTVCAGATITPSTYPSLVLSYANQDFDTVSGVNLGAFLTGVEVCPASTTGCATTGSSGTTYSYVGPGLEQDAGIAGYNLSSGSAALTWTMQNTQNQNAGANFSSTIAIKHQ